MIAAVLGVPGVGKTTVVREALKEVNIREVNYGDVFLGVAKELFGIDDRDKIRRILTADQYRELHRLASEKIKEMAKEPLLLDTHALVALETGFMPGFPKFVLESLPISLIILIEAEPGEILLRRKRDRRKRGGSLENLVELHQELNRMAAVVYAVEKGASIYVIRNREGEQAEAGRELAEVLRRWLSGISSR